MSGPVADPRAALPIVDRVGREWAGYPAQGKPLVSTSETGLGRVGQDKYKTFLNNGFVAGEQGVDEVKSISKENGGPPGPGCPAPTEKHLENSPEVDFTAGPDPAQDVAHQGAGTLQAKLAAALDSDYRTRPANWPAQWAAWSAIHARPAPALMYASEAEEEAWWSFVMAAGEPVE